ncbi:MAG: polysaccharide deacetylase family protein [Clostridia bacterium]|nr:polysaccharide deacetylase family protein [Clostridia bacterium]
MFGGKNKALTFSYDDGVTQDVRLIEIFNKYGLRATFNLNSGLLGKSGELVREGVKISHDKNKAEDIKYIYEGHEVAAHTLTHPSLPKIKDDGEVIRQVEEDRQRLSELVGYEVLGMAYPGGGVNCDGRVAELIKNNTPIKYARTIGVTHSFEPYGDVYQYKGTLYHHGDWEKLFETGQRFLELEADTPQVFYIWGHAYEFDIYPERWAIFEEFCRMMGGRSDIFYGTNVEILGKTN